MAIAAQGMHYIRRQGTSSSFLTVVIHFSKEGMLNAEKLSALYILPKEKTQTNADVHMWCHSFIHSLSSVELPILMSVMLEKVAGQEWS